MTATSIVPWTERLLDEFWRGFDPAVPAPVREGFSARLDVHDDDDAVVVTVDLPGLKRDDFEIVAQEDILTIRGERRADESGEKNGRRWTERRYGRFERSIRLPERASVEKASADFKDGVLTITVPKEVDAKAKPHRIDVQAA
jgi:HSP20 family protein